jgi:hypothetical protein
MNREKLPPSGVPQPFLPSFDYVKQELKRIPIAARIRLSQLGLSADLEQELHLAYYLIIKDRPTPTALKRTIHASGERLRYREVVRRAKYEVPEELAGRKYYLLMYGESPNGPSIDN